MSYLTVTLENDEGEEYTANLPASWSICSCCQGEGSQVHPSLSDWTFSDRYYDPEGFECMMAGDYDVPCTECKGTGKVLEAIERELLLEIHHKAYDHYIGKLEAEAEYQREVAAEARYFGY